MITDVLTLPKDTNEDCQLSVCLHHPLTVTRGCLQKLMSAFALSCLSSHSVQIERIVTTTTCWLFYHKMSISDDTGNSHLLSGVGTAKCQCPMILGILLMVALNGVGTAHFNPQPAVMRFLAIEQRASAPD